MRNTAGWISAAVAWLIVASLWSTAGAGQHLQRPRGDDPRSPARAASPGDLSRFVPIESRCPTFHWATRTKPRAFELAVFRLDPGTEAELVIERRFEGDVSVWTPPLEHCLERGVRYAWMVRALDPAGASDWSSPRLLEVMPEPTTQELLAALDVVRAYLEARDRAEAQPPGREARSRPEEETKSATGSSTEDTATRRGLRAGVETRLRVAGGVEATAFAGDGSALTGVDATTLDSLDASAFATASALSVHVGDSGNPHQVTAGQTTPATTKGDLEIFDGVGIARLPVGADGEVLKADSAAAAGVSWDTDARGVLPEQVCPFGAWMTGFTVEGEIVCSGLQRRLSPIASDASTPSMTLGADGHPVIAYFDQAKTTLQVAKCNDPACIGGDETISVVDASLDSPAGYASIALGSDDNPVIAYTSDSEVRLVKCDDPACTAGGETVSLVTDVGTEKRYTSVAIGTDGFPAISYWDSIFTAMWVAKCNDAACAGGDDAPTLPVELGLSGDFHQTSIAVGSDNLPVVTLFDGGGLRVVKCNDAACEDRDETSTLAVAGSVGRYPSIVLDASDRPVVSYWNFGDDDLELLWCNDEACAGGDDAVNTLDAEGSVGEHTSIARGADGFPIVSYFDATNGALKLADCSHPACIEGEVSLVTLDDPAVGIAGTSTSVALGSDGFVVVAYLRESSGVASLHAAKCADAACSF